MKRFIKNFLKAKDTREIHWLTLVSAIAAAVVLLLLCQPAPNKATFTYEEGRPWIYNSIIAPFNIPISKTAEEVKAERDSALKSMRPYFNCDTRVLPQQVEAFRKDFQKGRFGGLPATYLQHITQLLTRVYTAGVLSPDRFSELSGYHASTVLIVLNQEAIPRPVAELYSTRSAYEYIMSADTVLYTRELMARCNLNDYLTPNLLLDTAKTSAQRDDLLSSISSSSGMIQVGEKIIDRGEIIDHTRKRMIDSYVLEIERQDAADNSIYWVRTLGRGLTFTTLLSFFFSFLYYFSRRYLKSRQAILMITSLITVFPLLAFLLVSRNFLSVYVLPFAMIPVFIRIFFDDRIAFMALLTSLLITALGLSQPFEFLLIESIVGMTALLSVKDLTERAQLMRIALVTTLVALSFNFLLELASGTNIRHLDHRLYIYLLVSGVGLLFAHPMLYLLERVFGFTSSVTLVELSNINNDLLTEMSRNAQGTFSHSMQVANLATEVANRIGADAQLVRTGAFYHDIGKMLHPTYFTENQTDINPHDRINDEKKSAQIIIGHVVEGMKMAAKNNLPKEVSDFIRTHHGRGIVKYFYIQYKNKHPEEEVDVEEFTYPGPDPQTREQAILMMCDSVEASSRSLKEYTPETISELVHRIVDGQVSEGRFKQCPISFLEIEQSKQVLIEMLKKSYHTRISYPELNKPAEETPEETMPHSFAGLFGRRRRN